MVIFKAIDKNDQTLQVFVNKEGYVMFEIEPEGNIDHYSYQSLVLNLADTQALILELQSLVKDYSITETE